MDWIKKNPAQLALALIALGVLGATFMLWTNTSGFAESLPMPSAPPPVKGIPELKLETLEKSRGSVAKPATWTPDRATMGSLFVSNRYVLVDGKLTTPQGGMFNPPVPNAWLDKYALDALNSNILSEDPDKDGFNNLLEYLGLDGKVGTEDSTDPTKADSKPPYHTRLALAKIPGSDNGIVSIPFRLILKSYDINPRNPKDITVQINTIDRGNRTRFVAVGEDIPETTYKTESFEKKETPGPEGTVVDVSELKIVNKATGGKLTLKLGKMEDSPDSYIVLRYQWVAVGGQPTPDMNKKKGDKFTLPPENDKEYEVLEISAPDKRSQPPKRGEVTIKLPTGEKLLLTTEDPDLPK